MREDEHGSDGGVVPGLEGLYADREAPPELEGRVMEDFRSTTSAARRPRGRSGSWRARTIVLQLAAALVVFAVGWGLGASTPWALAPADVAGPSGSAAGYMMLLWENEAPSPSDDPADVAEAYASWARSLAESGIAVSGEELGAERVFVGDVAPSALEESRVGGFFLVDAETLDEARSLAEGHPHVAAGGAIEVAPVVRR